MPAALASRIHRVEILQRWWPIQCLGTGCDEPAAYRLVFEEERSTWLCPDCVLIPGLDSNHRQSG